MAQDARPGSTTSVVPRDEQDAAAPPPSKAHDAAADSAVPPDGPVRAPAADVGTMTGRRVRARLARLTATKAGGTPPVLEPLTRTIRTNHPKADLRDVIRAYEVAEHHHEGQRRQLPLRDEAARLEGRHHQILGRPPHTRGGPTRGCPAQRTWT